MERFFGVIIYIVLFVRFVGILIVDRVLMEGVLVLSFVKNGISFFRWRGKCWGRGIYVWVILLFMVWDTFREWVFGSNSF